MKKSEMKKKRAKMKMILISKHMSTIYIWSFLLRLFKVLNVRKLEQALHFSFRHQKSSRHGLSQQAIGKFMGCWLGWKWMEVFEAYLSNLQQFVSINGHRSDVLPVTSDVPQSSILGPMLFTIYINSLPMVLQFATCLLYADDTKCYKRLSLHSDSVLLQSNLTNLLSWSHTSKILFNLLQSLLLRFCNKSTNINNLTYFFNGSSIKSASSCKDLGIIVSSGLSWSQHYNMIISRVYHQLAFIPRTFSVSIPIRVKNCCTSPWWGHSSCTAVKYGDHIWLNILLLLKKFKKGPQNIF